jgi:hypothetical protein
VEPPPEAITIDGSHQLTLRVQGLFDAGRSVALEEALKRIREVKLLRIDHELAEATLAYDPHCNLFRNASADVMRERLDHLLRPLSNHTLAFKAHSPLPREAWERLEIPIGGLDCQACCLSAYEALALTEGVEQATASFRTGLAVVWIDPTRTNRLVLEQALEQRGATIRRPPPQ